MTHQDLMQLATKGDVQQLCSTFLAKMEEMLKKASPSNDKYYDIDEVAAETGFSRQTVDKWIKVGKKDQAGQLIKLPYSEFAPGTYRVKRSDLEAFGKVGQIELPAHMRVAS